VNITRIIPLCAAAAATVALAGCASTSMSANTSCSDFLHATQAAQDVAVSSIASDLHAANAVTPLGRPNINYICASSPETTLGEAIRQTG
jgi:hypothetical protein